MEPSGSLAPGRRTRRFPGSDAVLGQRRAHRRVAGRDGTGADLVSHPGGSLAPGGGRGGYRGLGRPEVRDRQLPPRLGRHHHRQRRQRSGHAVAQKTAPPRARGQADVAGGGADGLAVRSGGATLVVAGFELGARAVGAGGRAGQPVASRLPVGGRDLGQGQAPVQRRRRPGVDGQFVSAADGQQARRLALGDGTGPGGQDLSRDRQPEYRRADKQGPRPGAEAVEQLAEHMVAGRAGNQLGGSLGELGGFGPRQGLAGPRPDHRLDRACHIRVALAAGQQPVQVLHGERMAGHQAPDLVAFGVAEQPERGQRGGQLGSPGAGQRTELAEGELAVAPAEGERLTAGDQELARPAG